MNAPRADESSIQRSEELFAGWIAVTRAAIQALQEGNQSAMTEQLDARAAIARELDVSTAAVRRLLDAEPARPVPPRLRDAMEVASRLEKQMVEAAEARRAAIGLELERRQAGVVAAHAYAIEGPPGQTLDRRS